MDPRVKLGHMDCLVQTASPTAPTTTTADVASEGMGEGLGVVRSGGGSGGVLNGGEGYKVAEEVTFLYRLCDGSSPKSYGINVSKVLLIYFIYCIIHGIYIMYSTLYKTRYYTYSII